MEMKDGVMIMRPVEGGLEIPAGETVELKPGGLHIMFMAVSEPFNEGETVPVTLEFEKAGSVELNLPVGPRDGGAPGQSGH
jgi:copper(I)-binding protein